ncbi:hypothetical protein QZM97_02640 [Burkholderia orbicola]|uniref:hypothetical protein n=1 Tax=Burkholderia orbicola TaxID=2978683 RepID=UPI0026535CB2|nr:hypothetical protein [Burkholderia orbicola]MDN7988967.1 hypothetical protein [Burkholderia orbicola]
MSAKALKACADYARLNAEIKRLTVAIGEALDGCKGMKGTMGIGADGMKYGAHDDDTHLREAFRPETVDDGYGEGSTEWSSDAEIREFLTEHCAACLKAYELVLQRKAAKKAFGAAKRSIGAIGRAELAKEA